MVKCDRLQIELSQCPSNWENDGSTRKNETEGVAQIAQMISFREFDTVEPGFAIMCYPSTPRLGFPELSSTTREASKYPNYLTEYPHETPG